MKEVFSLVFRIKKEEISFKRKNSDLKLKRYNRFTNKLLKISIFLEYNEKHNPLETLVEPCTFENFVRNLSTKNWIAEFQNGNIFKIDCKTFFLSNVEQCVAFLHFDFMPSCLEEFIIYESRVGRALGVNIDIRWDHPIRDSYIINSAKNIIRHKIKA